MSIEGIRNIQHEKTIKPEHLPGVRLNLIISEAMRMRKDLKPEEFILNNTYPKHDVPHELVIPLAEDYSDYIKRLSKSKGKKRVASDLWCIATKIDELRRNGESINSIYENLKNTKILGKYCINR